jgi:hypothetical protein
MWPVATRFCMPSQTARQINSAPSRWGGHAISEEKLWRRWGSRLKFIWEKLACDVGVECGGSRYEEQSPRPRCPSCGEIGSAPQLWCRLWSGSARVGRLSPPSPLDEISRAWGSESRSLSQADAVGALTSRWWQLGDTEVTPISAFGVRAVQKRRGLIYLLRIIITNRGGPGFSSESRIRVDWSSQRRQPWGPV